MPNTAHERIDRISRHLSATAVSRSPGAAAGARAAMSNTRPPITSHALDTATGKPAEGLPLKLELRGEGGSWLLVGSTAANSDGRAPGLLPPGSVSRLAPLLYVCSKVLKRSLGKRIPHSSLLLSSVSVTWYYRTLTIMMLMYRLFTKEGS